MTIYRTRYRDPKRHSWINDWSPTHVVAELYLAYLRDPYGNKICALHRG